MKNRSTHALATAAIVTLVVVSFDNPANADHDAKSVSAAAKPARNAVKRTDVTFNRCARIPRGRKVKVTLKPQSSLADLVGWISGMTCKRFVVPGGLRTHTVTVLAPSAISPDEAYRLFVSALHAMGLTVVPAGNALKIISANWAGQSPLTLRQDRDRFAPLASDAPLTQLLRPQHVSAATLLPILHKLKSTAGQVELFAPTNTLIITDAGLNVRRIVAIVAALDIPGQRQALWVVKPRFIEAAELAKLLGQLMGSTGRKPSATTIAVGPTRGRGGRTGRGRSGVGRSAGATRVDLQAPQFIAEPHSNSLIVVADGPSYRRAMALVREVDVAPDGVQSRLWVYRLEHAKADVLAKALARIVRNRSHSGNSRRGRRSTATQNGASSFEGPISVEAETTNNALLVYASARDYLALQQVIATLDKPRRQVFIEAHIMEVSVNNDRNLGIAFHGGSATVVGALTHGVDFNSISSSPAALTGLALGVFGPTVSGSGKLLGLDHDIPAFGLVVEALQTRGRVKVLSSPHLLTTDNEKAVISVGDRIPVRSGIAASALSSTTQSGTSLPLSLVQPVQRELVGLKLALTPTIGHGDSVRLQIEQEASEIRERSFDGLGAATSERKVETVVTVRNGHTVVIGGLMKEKFERSTTSVPILGDIPLIGLLFRRSGVVRRKVNLVIVLTPHIIKTRADLQRIFRRKLVERQRFMYRWMHDRGAIRLSEVDFSTKRGLLAEINATGIEQETKAELARQSAKTIRNKSPTSVKIVP